MADQRVRDFVAEYTNLTRTAANEEELRANFAVAAVNSLGIRDLKLERARHDIRRNRVIVEFKDKGLKAHMGRASKTGAAWVVIVGDDELKKGRYPLKDMSSGIQTEGTPEEIIQSVKDRG